LTSAQSFSEAFRRNAWWITFLPIVLLHALFVFTFPLNNLGGDTSNYFSMLVTGDSSLVHASGYPFLMGLPFRHGPMAALTNGVNPDLDSILLIAQHGISIIAMVALFLVVRQIYGSFTASVATLTIGMNLLFMGATSAVYPEWLQASLLIMSGWAAASGYFHTSGRGKVLWYAFSVVVFAWCFLVKFNAAVLAVLYVLPLAAERWPWKIKFLWSGVYALLVAGTIVSYQVAVQQPRTGTRRLTADTGWALLNKIQWTYGNKLAESNGLETKRWLALASALPMEYGLAGAGMFRHVDAVPSAVRTPYRPVFNRIVAADERFLNEWLRSHPVPNGFVVSLSPIPVCYFVGLFEGNDLAVKVAIEAVRADPVTFAKASWREFLGGITAFPSYPFVPSKANMPIWGFTVKEPLPHGRMRLNQPTSWGSVPYAYRSPVVWWRGLNAFESLDDIRRVDTLTILSADLAVITAVLSVIRRRRLSMETAVVLVVSAALTLFIAASAITLAFRWKEFCLALPLFAVLAGAGVGWAPREAVRLLRTPRRP
jgi:hypothetical protein